MKKMAELAEREGVVLLHENEKDIWGELPEQCDRIIREVNSPALRAVFDPANFIQAGAKPYPDAFVIMKPHIEYMHIKDAGEDKKVVPAGYGIGGIDKILAVPAGMGIGGIPELLAVINNSHTGDFILTLEPHLQVFKGLEALEGDNKTEMEEGSTPEKFTLAYESLMKIVKSI